MAQPFKDAGKAAGVSVWRVEQLKPVPIDEPAQLGQFYTGDAYVVLHTKAGAGGSSSLSHDAHFWLGAECSQDEAGAAAIFTTELDDALGGKAVQFRQVQGSESPEFLQAFGGRVTYRQGGAKSGFRHVQPSEATPPALLRIKGEAHARVTEVPAAVDSLASGDVFLYDGGERLLLWAGAGASVAEKARAREVLTSLTEARGGRPRVTHLAEGEPEAQELYRLLGAAEPGSVAIPPASADAPSADGKAFSASRLYKVADSEGGGGVSVSEVQQRPLARGALQSDSVFAFAAGGKLYLWQGGGASRAERRAGLQLASRLLAELQLPASTPVQLEKDGMESLTFKEHFDWSGAASGGSTPRPQSAASQGRGRKGAKAQPSPAAAAASPAAAAAASPAAGAPGKAPAAQDGASPPASTGKGPAQAAGHERSPAASPAKGAGSAAASPAAAAAKEAVEPEAPASNGGPGKLSLPKHLADGAGGLPFVPKPVAPAPSPPPPKPAQDVRLKPGQDVLPYEQLKGMRPEDGVDMTAKELYLSSEEFQKVFGKSAEEFKAQPKWRQLRAKKEVGLF